MTRRKTTIAYEKGSGNVFADLGLPHPEQELLKARLTLQIYRDIKARDLTHGHTAHVQALGRALSKAEAP